MENPSALTSCLLLLVGVATAQSAPPPSSRLLPQWLTGLIAVSGFLFLAFVSFLVKRAWCESSRSNMESVNMDDLDMMRRSSSEMNPYETSVDVLSKDANAYTNMAADCSEDRATAM